VSQGGLGLTQGTQYFLCIRARDVAGIVAAAYSCSNGQRPDTGGPASATPNSPVADIGYAVWPALSATYNEGTVSSPGRIDFELCSDSACVSSVTVLANSNGGLANAGVGTVTPAVANGTYWWRVRARDTAGNVSGWSVSPRRIDIGTSSTSISVSSGTAPLGLLSSGIDSTSDTVVTVATNASNGYQLLADDNNDSRFLQQGAIAWVPDWTGTVDVPLAWTAGTPGYAGVTVRAVSNGTRLPKWGTAGGPYPANDYVNNAYAGLKTAATDPSQVLHSRATYAVANETVTLTWRANPQVSLAAGSYSNLVNLTLVGVP
jgi:hypothetical protein